MRFFRLMLLALVVLGVVGAGAGWYLAGREAGPSITIKSPEKYLGRAGTLDAVAESATPVVAMTATLEQNGQSTLVASYANDGTLRNQVALSGALGKTAQPALVNGPATLTVKATRQVFFGLRTVDSSVTRELQVRMDPARIAVTSIHHFINLGGAEFVVMRATPEDVEAGVRVGEVEYFVDRHQSWRCRDEGPGVGPHWRDRARRRRSLALHDPAAGRAGEPHRVVGSALAAGPGVAENCRGWRPLNLVI